MTSIGVKPNQIPVNGMLGTMAFQDAEAVNISAGKIGGKTVAELNSAASDAREWTAETVPEDEARGGESETRRAWSALRVFQAIAGWWAGSEAKQKLDNIAAEATKNESDEHLLDRTNHTGTQAISTVEGLETALELKAALNSPTFAGDPKAPTPAATDNDTSIATTAFVRAAMGLFGLDNPSTQQVFHTGNFDPATKQDKSSVIGTATTRTLSLADAWNYVRPGTTSAITLTVPADASVAFDVSTEITVRALGNITLASASGVTLNAPSGGTLSMTARMTVTLKKVGTNEWDVIGQTVAA